MTVTTHDIFDYSRAAGWTWERTDASSRPYAKKTSCCFCRRRFKQHPKYGWRGTSIAVGERQVNWFRGDDEVVFAHRECLAAYRGYLKGQEEK